jgi:hypothetical protein
MSRWSNLIVFSILASILAMVGCSKPQDTSVSTEEVQSQSSAITSPTWAVPDCTAASLAPPGTNKCNGVWQWHWQDMMPTNPATPRAGATGRSTSSQGTTKPTSPGTATVSGDTRVFVDGPECQTCDQIAFDTPAGAQQKFDCLKGMYATQSSLFPGTVSDAKKSILSRSALLYQLAGERLRPDQVTTLQGYYSDTLASQMLATACRVSTTFPTACYVGGNTNNALLFSKPHYRLCMDLVYHPLSPTLKPNISAAVANSAVTQCINFLSELGASTVPDACLTATAPTDLTISGIPNTQSMRDLIDAVVIKLISRADTQVADLPQDMAPVPYYTAWNTAAATLARGNSAWLPAEKEKLRTKLLTVPASDWVHPACTSSALKSPGTNLCSGPWSFGWQDMLPTTPPTPRVGATGTTLTSPGAIKPTNAGTPTNSGDTRIFVGNGPACLTCDELPFDTTARIQTKFDSLKSTYDAEVANAPTALSELRSSAGARLKLLYQYGAEKLRSEQVALVQALYSSSVDKDSGSACRAGVGWPAPCFANGTNNLLFSQPHARLCKDLADNALTSVSAAAINAPGCIAHLGDELGATAVPDSCIAGAVTPVASTVTVRDVMDKAVRGVIAKAVNPLTHVTTDLTTVQHFSAWKSAATHVVRGSSTWLNSAVTAFQAMLVVGPAIPAIPSGPLPDCTVAALGPPRLNACNGSWKFSYKDTTQDVSICGLSECTQHADAFNWDFATVGDGQSTSTVEAQSGQPHAEPDVGNWHNRNCRTTCGQFSGCSGPICTGEELNFQACPQSVADARKNAILASLPPGLNQAHADQFTVTTSADVQFTEEGDTDPVFGSGLLIQDWTWNDCKLTFTNYPVQTHGPFPINTCTGRAPPLTCDRPGLAGSFVSGSGEDRPVNAGVPAYPGDTRIFTSSIDCLTCDEIPIATAANVQAKFTCLKGVYDVTPEGSLRASVVARMKLLLQLAGEKLSTGAPNQLQIAKGLYDSDPSAGTLCQHAVSLPPACVANGTPLLQTTPLQLCQDFADNPLTSHGVAVSTGATLCLDRLTELGGASVPEACRLAIRDQVDSAVIKVVSKAEPNFTSDLALDLATALGYLAQWSTAAGQVAGTDLAWLSDQTKIFSGNLWQNIQNGLPPVEHPSDATNALRVLRTVSDEGFTNDFTVLSALFAPSGTLLDTPPLLALTGDALLAFSDRLDDLEILHDTACRFAVCKNLSTLRKSPTSLLLQALASLGDPSALGTALALPYAQTLHDQQPALFEALQRVQAQHARLRTAWSKLARPEPFSDLAKLSDPPPEAATLATIVRKASIAWNSYQATGLFVPWHSARLSTAVLKQQEMLNTLTGQLSQFQGARNTYVAELANAVNNFLALGQQQSIAAAATLRLGDLKRQNAEIQGRLDGLASREEQEQTAIGTYQAAFEKLINSGGLDLNSNFDPQVIPQVQVAAAAATHVQGHATDPVADSFMMQTLQSGDALHISVSGEWSPTCAIHNGQILGPDGRAANIQFGPSGGQQSSALTGPEGYWVSWADNFFQAHTHDDSRGSSDSLSISAEACAGTPPATGNTMKVCVTANHTENAAHSDVNANGHEVRLSASFNTGVRMIGTPYLQAPAGSLVAVLTPHGNPSFLLDVQVVHRNEVIYAPALAPPMGTNLVDVYFVVNDFACSLHVPNALKIDMVKTTPLGSVAQAIGAAMAQELFNIEASSAGYLAEGQLSSFEATVIRGEANLALLNALAAKGHDATAVPPALRQLYDAFVDREIASIARRAEQHALALQANSVLTAIDQIFSEDQFNQNAQHLLKLLPRLSLRDFAGQNQNLIDRVSNLAKLLTESVVTVYELRAPTALASFRSTGQLTALIENLNITDPFDTSLNAFDTFVGNTLGTLGNGQFNFDIQQPSRHPVVVSIPRSPSDCDNSTPIDQHSLCGQYHPVSRTAAQQFWTSLDRSAALARRTPVVCTDTAACAGRAEGALCLAGDPPRHCGCASDGDCAAGDSCNSDHRCRPIGCNATEPCLQLGSPLAVVTLSPEDLYLPGSTSPASLSCNDVVPVARRMSMFINTNGQTSFDFLALGYTASSGAAIPTSTVFFPALGQTLAYNFNDPSGLGMKLPLMNGSSGEDLAKFGFDPSHAGELGAAAGMSPFTSFTVDMSPMYFNADGSINAAFSTVHVVSLVFEVENVSFSPGVVITLPGVCQPVTP